jgi:hypothetical protein
VCERRRREVNRWTTDNGEPDNRTEETTEKVEEGGRGWEPEGYRIGSISCRGERELELLVRVAEEQSNAVGEDLSLTSPSEGRMQIFVRSRMGSIVSLFI